MALISRREGLALGREAAQVLDLELFTALFESLLNLALHVENLLLHTGVPVVFDGIVGAALQLLSYDGPLIFVIMVLNVEDKLLFQTPVILFNSWIQMVVPAFATLLTDTAR